MYPLDKNHFTRVGQIGLLRKLSPRWWWWWWWWHVFLFSKQTRFFSNRQQARQNQNSSHFVNSTTNPFCSLFVAQDKQLQQQQQHQQPTSTDNKNNNLTDKKIKQCLTLLTQLRYVCEDWEIFFCVRNVLFFLFGHTRQDSEKRKNKCNKSSIV